MVRRLRVLVIDNNEDIVSTLTRLIKLVSDCETQGGHDASECRSLVETFKPDLLLLNLGMPAIDGFSTLRSLRADGLAPPRTIAMTGYTIASVRERAEQAGFDGIEIKPLTVERLRERIAEATLSVATNYPGRMDFSG